MNCCKCILADRKFYNKDGTINKQKLSIIFEKWYEEQIIYGIKKEIAFDVINSYAKNLCSCQCHHDK